MHAAFAELLDEMDLGNPIVDGAWAFVPLSTKRKSRLDYLTLFDAADEGLVTVTEVSDAGSVGALKVTNNAPLPLFIPDGITLVGCKQNRVVNVSILIPAQTVSVIPVSCVEQRRWYSSSSKAAPSEMSDSRMRSAMCDQTTSSLQHNGIAQANQCAVWQHVDDVLRSVQASSPTSAYHAAYAAQWRSQEIACPEGFNGVAIVQNNRICSIDLFDQPATLKTMWPRIMRGTLPMSAASSGSNTEIDDPRKFLTECLSKPQGEFAPIGLGTHHRFRNDASVASGLVVDGQLLHLCAFRKNGQGHSAQAVRPVEPPTRPWWRLWR